MAIFVLNPVSLITRNFGVLFLLNLIIRKIGQERLKKKDLYSFSINFHNSICNKKCNSFTNGSKTFKIASLIHWCNRILIVHTALRHASSLVLDKIQSREERAAREGLRDVAGYVKSCLHQCWKKKNRECLRWHRYKNQCFWRN